MDRQKTQDCPSLKRLRGLLSGELAASDQDAVTQHIEACPSCQHTLDDWLASPSVEGLAAAGKDSATQEAVLHELMDNIKKKSVGDMTQAEPTDSRDESLAFLAPSKKPGHLGRLGQYEILSVIGKGGFGIVFKAFDDKLHRMVAIKVLAPELAASGTARKRFIREAQAAAAVNNDHVVAIYNVADEANPPYLVMELIDGISLEDRLKKEGPLELKEILRIGMQMAEGLAAAHKQGLIHRDIKPGNILLENGVQRVKITDFGLARAADDASVTQSGVIAGTPMFMSPEQAEGAALDARSDLFSLGSVLYVMCTGRAPFRATTTIAVLKRVCDETPTSIRDINPDVPACLCAIVERMQAKKVENRYGSAKEVAELLGKHLAEVQAHGRAEPRKWPVDTPANDDVNRPLTGLGSPMLIAGSLAVVALVTTLGVIYWPRSGGEVVPPEKKEVVENNNPPVVKPDNNGWLQLFNGKDLTGWKHANWLTMQWKVEDGNLVAIGGPKTLYYDSEFKDVHCRIEVKINGDAWGTLAIRGIHNDPAVSTPITLVPNRAGGIWQAGVNTKPLFDPFVEPTIEADTWATVEIIAKDTAVTVIVNGKTTCTKSIDFISKQGKLVVQQASPTGTMIIRKVEVKELPPEPAEAQPFVVPAKAGRKETRHPTLAAAIAAAAGPAVDGATSADRAQARTEAPGPGGQAPHVPAHLHLERLDEGHPRGGRPRMGRAC